MKVLLMNIILFLSINLYSQNSFMILNGKRMIVNYIVHLTNDLYVIQVLTEKDYKKYIAITNGYSKLDDITKVDKDIEQMIFWKEKRIILFCPKRYVKKIKGGIK